MTLTFRDEHDQVGISILTWQGDDRALYKRMLLKNTGSETEASVKVKLAEHGLGAFGAEEIPMRAVGLLSYTRQLTGMGETAYVALGPASAKSEIPDELEAVALDGQIQMSVDTFRWGAQINIGNMEADVSILLFLKYVLPPYTETQILRMTIKNIGEDTFQNATLTGQDGDLVSLDGLTFTSSVSLGDLASGALKTIWFKTSKIPVTPIDLEVEAYVEEAADPSVRLPLNVGGFGQRMCSVQDVRECLSGLGISLVVTDEEIANYLAKASRKIERDSDYVIALAEYKDLKKATEVGMSSRPGSTSELDLEKYPAVLVKQVRILDGRMSEAEKISSTDSDFADVVQLDQDLGTVFLDRDLEADEFVEVVYVAGFPRTPADIREAATKLAVIEVLREKGSSDSQGAAAVSISGYTESYPRGHPFGQLIQDLQADIDKVIQNYRVLDGVLL